MPSPANLHDQEIDFLETLAAHVLDPDRVAAVLAWVAEAVQKALRQGEADDRSGEDPA